MARSIVVFALFIGVIGVVVRMRMLVGAPRTFTTVALSAWRTRLLDPFEPSVAVPVDMVVVERYWGGGGVCLFGRIKLKKLILICFWFFQQGITVSTVTGRLGSRFVLTLNGRVVAISVGVDVPCFLNRDRGIGVCPATVALLTSDILCALCNNFLNFLQVT